MGVPFLVLLLSPWAYPSHANCLMQGKDILGKEYQALGLEKGQEKSGILSWQKSGNPASEICPVRWDMPSQVDVFSCYRRCIYLL